MLTITSLSPVYRYQLIGVKIIPRIFEQTSQMMTHEFRTNVQSDFGRIILNKFLKGNSYTGLVLHDKSHVKECLDRLKVDLHENIEIIYKRFEEYGPIASFEIIESDLGNE